MKIPIVFFLLVYFSQIAFSQPANLEITVVDQSSAVIPNAVARLKKDKIIIKEIQINASQKVSFSKLNPANYILEVESPGFKNYSEEIEIKVGNWQKTVQMEIAEVVENVSVDRSKQDKNLDPRDGAFTNFLTKAEILALPDDPALLKKALKEKFGDDAEFLVNGFSSDGLPNKSQIASIKVSQSSFDSEYHKIGIAIIEITTKPTNRFFGLFSFDFNDARLNARNPFSPIRYPAQNKSFDMYLLGPINKKTSFSIGLSKTDSYNNEIVTAKLPNGNFNSSIKSLSDRLYLESRITYSLSQFQTINLAYSHNRNNSKNLGVGGFNLPERAFNLNSQRHQFRYSQVGNIRARFYNEFRFQYENETSKTVSANNETAIIVLDAFNRGGAGNDSSTKNHSFSVADNFLWGIKNHALKIGGIVNFEKQDSTSAENQNGTFTFSSLDNFLANQPSIFTQKLGTRQVKFSQVQIGAFFQDDIRVHKSLMLSLGLRYEWQNNLKDKNNFSPRIGFSWSPSEESKSTFRGGFGVFYNWFDSNALATILSQDQTQPTETIIITPNFPNPFSSGTSQILPKSYWQKDSQLKNPYVFLGQIGVQRQLTEKSSLRVQYTYQKVIHQFRSRDLNAPINLIRPNQTLGRILQFESSAFALRNQIKIDFETSPSKRTFLSINYRIGKTVSDANGNFGLPSDNYNLKLDRAVSNTDQRHYIYSTFGLAFSKGLRFSTIFRANSALPYTITTGKDDNGDTIFNDRPSGFSRNSERGEWNKQFDTSLSWQFNLGKKKGNSPVIADPNAEFFSGKTLKLVINATNIFNQTNFTNYVGVQTSPFFRQPISANNSRRIELGLRFSF